MSDLKFDREKSNLGGINEFKFIYEDELVGSFEIINGAAHNIVLSSDFNSVDIVPETGSFKEEEKAVDLFLYEFNALIPQDTLEKLQAAKKLDSKKIIAIVKDNNNQSRILGQNGNSCMVQIVVKKQGAVSSLNHYEFSIEWKSRHRAPFTDENFFLIEQYQFEDEEDFFFEDGEPFHFND